MESQRNIPEEIRQVLDGQMIVYKHITHEPTFTSEESAKARGEDMKIGGKAILLKTDDIFKLFILSAVFKLDSGAIRKFLNVKNTRFATKEELLELTGLVPGSVPPFGRPIFDFEMYADPSVLENEKIAFNAGSLTESLVMSAADWQRVADPIVFTFAVI